MTDRQGTAEGRADEGPDESLWRVEGSEADAYGDGGLGDTVVRLPRIPADGPPPEPHTPPKARPKSRTRTSSRPAAQPVKPVEAKPAEVAGPVDAVAPVVPPPAAATGPSAVTEPVGVARPEVALPAEPARPVADPSADTLDDPTTVRRPVGAPHSPFAEPDKGRPDYSEPTMPTPAAPTSFLPSAPVVPTPAPVPAAVPAAPVAVAPKPKASGLRRTRKARLRLSKVDPWSVMKTSFLFSIAFGIMFWVAVSVVWTVVISSGLFDVINQAIVNIISSPNAQTTWRIEDYVNTNKVLGITALLAVINVVISTALGTLTAFLYNLSANILGGLELTLAED